MLPSTCSTCHALLRSHLRARITTLELKRRRLHSSPTVRASPKGTHIESLYVDTIQPDPAQLVAAKHFFTTHAPTKAWTASEWRKHISQHSESVNDIAPEVAFIGRSNSGKSSLLNAVLSSPGLCRVGPQPGKTTTMHAWSLSRSQPGSKSSKGAMFEAHPKLTVLDMPGYGHGSRTEWGQEIIKYMRRRRQLRRAFVLLNPKHGIKASDEQILQVLRAEGIAHQIVACKCDDVKASELSQRLEELRDMVTRSAVAQEAQGLILNDVLAVGNLGDGRANQKVEIRNMRGVGNVRWAILQATGLDQYAVTQHAESMKPRQDKRPLRIVEPYPSLQKSHSIETNSRA